MSESTIGVVIIIGIILIEIVTGREIFRGEQSKQPNRNEISSETNEIIYPSDPPVTRDPGRGPSGSGSQNLSPEAQLRQIEEQLRLLKIEVEKEIENKNASIYRGKVNLSYIPGSSSYSGYIDISSSYNLGQSVRVTGWKIRSTVTGNEQFIGTAVNLPQYDPATGRDVVLPPSGRVVVSQISSPIGLSFRVNKCVGFFEQNTNFTPILSNSCPAVSLPPLSNEFNSVCLNYIERFPRCEVPYEYDFPEALTSSCRNYLLTQISYNQCVARHKSDIDFYKNEWRVYSPSSRFLWLDRRETLQLIDSGGKIVDTYTY